MPSASSRGSGDHARHQQVGVDERAELGEVDAVAQVGGGRGEHVAAGERRARRGEVVLGVGQLDGALGAADDRDGRREQAVVGPDEHAGAAGDLDRDRPPRRADAGVDDRQHDALGRRRGSPGPAPASRRGRRTGGCRG